METLFVPSFDEVKFLGMSDYFLCEGQRNYSFAKIDIQKMVPAVIALLTFRTRIKYEVMKVGLLLDCTANESLADSVLLFQKFKRQN